MELLKAELRRNDKISIALDGVMLNHDCRSHTLPTFIPRFRAYRIHRRFAVSCTTFWNDASFSMGM